MDLIFRKTKKNNEWLAYDFQSPVAISKYAVEDLNYHGLEFAPVSWTFEGSSDNVSWTILDEQTGHTDWSDGQVKEFMISHSGNSD